MHCPSSRFIVRPVTPSETDGGHSGGGALTWRSSTRGCHPRNYAPAPRPPTRVLGPAAAVHESPPRLPHQPATQASRGSVSPTTTHGRSGRGERRPAGQLKRPISYRPQGFRPRAREGKAREESPTPAEAGSGRVGRGEGRRREATGGRGPHADRLQPPSSALRRAAGPQAAPSAAAVRGGGAARRRGGPAEEAGRGGGRVRVALRRAPRAGEARAWALQGEPATVVSASSPKRPPSCFPPN